MKTLLFNWKLNPLTAVAAEKLFRGVAKAADKKKVKIAVAAPFVYLERLSKISAAVELAAQDVWFKEQGSFTGEVSATMLKNLKVKNVIIGHSERRAMGETDELVNLKVKAALEAGLKVVVCVGENKNVPFKQAFELVKRQVELALKGLDLKKQHKKILLAYEPIWAIGTGKSAIPEEASQMALELKNYLKLGDGLDVLYGGSVNSRNAKDFFQAEGIQGALVGGASLDLKEVKKIIQAI